MKRIGITCHALTQLKASDRCGPVSVSDDTLREACVASVERAVLSPPDEKPDLGQGEYTMLVTMHPTEENGLRRTAYLVVREDEKYGGSFVILTALNAEELRKRKERTRDQTKTANFLLMVPERNHQRTIPLDTPQEVTLRVEQLSKEGVQLDKIRVYARVPLL